MTCSRLFILGALVGGGALVNAAPAALAQPASGTPAAKAPAKAAKAPAKGAAPATAAAPAAVAAPAKYPFGLPEARVRGVQNQVEIVAAADKRPAKRDDVVQPGHRIETGNAASTELAFADGTRVLVGENSQLSVYGAAPVAPAGKKAKPFKPSSNTLTKGEVFVSVPLPAAPPAPVAAPAGKKAQKPVKVTAPKLPATAIVATPVGKVRILPGARARITVNPAGVTIVSVYEGTAELQGLKGKPTVLAAGTGSRLQDIKTLPGAPAPLPAIPATTGVQTLVFSTGAPVEVRGSYASPAGAPAAAQWHVQVARTISSTR